MQPPTFLFQWVTIQLLKMYPLSIGTMFYRPTSHLTHPPDIQSTGFLSTQSITCIAQIHYFINRVLTRGPTLATAFVNSVCKNAQLCTFKSALPYQIWVFSSTVYSLRVLYCLWLIVCTKSWINVIIKIIVIVTDKTKDGGGNSVLQYICFLMNAFGQ